MQALLLERTAPKPVAVIRSPPPSRPRSRPGDASVINAIVPLTNMFGFLNTLGSLSQGRPTSTVQFSHYAPVPVVPVPPDDDPFPPAMAAAMALVSGTHVAGERRGSRR
jgi:translation elongation factor EF-G